MATRWIDDEEWVKLSSDVLVVTNTLWESIKTDMATLRKENATLRQRVRFHDSFLETMRAAILKAQGVEKGAPLASSQRVPHSR